MKIFLLAALSSSFHPCWAVEEYLPIVNSAAPNACVWLRAHAISLLKEQRAVFSQRKLAKSLAHNYWSPMKLVWERKLIRCCFSVKDC